MTEAEIKARIELAEVTRAAAKACRAVARRIAAIDRHIEECGPFERVRQTGELLRGAVHIRKGTRTARVTDWYADPPAEVSIPVDPARDRFANAEKYFKRARKLERAIPHDRTHRAEAAALLGRMEATARELAEGTLEAAAAAKRLKAAGFGRFLPECNRPVEEKPDNERLRKFTSSDGLTIYVGRNAEENDYVTFRVGSGLDPWLHVTGFHGSHVVVKVPKSTECPRRTIEEAAALAVYYSKARGNFKQEVTWGRACDVRKAARRKAGLVTVANPKYIRTDPKALDRVMGSRTDKEGAEPDDGGR
ncbi:MAG: NFACT RNA binding domain-containing protein [Planctomycetota bacterium]